MNIDLNQNLDNKDFFRICYTHKNSPKSLGLTNMTGSDMLFNSIINI